MNTAREARPAEQHDLEIRENLEHWRRKPLLQKVYRGFYEEIARRLAPSTAGATVELGSGIGNLKSVMPDCIATDLFPNPWIDRVENAYRLSFGDASLDNVLLFDVFHHLEYPGTALDEIARAVRPGGRLVVFEPDVSLLGRVVYGVFHHEPLALGAPIRWHAPTGFDPDAAPYYAAQGNASRVFRSTAFDRALDEAGWRKIEVTRLSSLSYVASGGFRGRQLYPEALYGTMRRVDRLASLAAPVFSTRLLVVMERTTRSPASRATGAAPTSTP